MSDTDAISVSQLISLVRERPVLWDRQREVYKNRKLTKKAWAEICELLVDNYEELDEHHKKSLERGVTGKWANLRDNWLRYWRKRQHLIATGEPLSSVKKYIHHEQLLFLSKVYDPGYQEVEEIQVEVDVISDPEMDGSQDLDYESSERLWDFPEESFDFTQMQQERHIYFFNSIFPMLCEFDNDQTVDFQMAVLDCIRRIRQCGNLCQVNQPIETLTDFPEESSKGNGNTPPSEIISSGHLLENLLKNSRKSDEASEDNPPDNAGCKQKRNTELNAFLETHSHKSDSVKLCLDSLNSAVHRLQKISRKMAASHFNNKNESFGKYIGSELNSLPPRNVRILKRKIVSEIHRLRIDKKCTKISKKKNFEVQNKKEKTC